VEAVMTDKERAERLLRDIMHEPADEDAIVLSALREAVAEERRALREKIDFYKTDKKSGCDIWTLELLTTFLLNRAALDAAEPEVKP
jgi:hypothetical protein